MAEFVFKIADISIKVRSIYNYAKYFCRNYLTDETAEINVTITQDDIEKERIYSANQNIAEGKVVINYPDEYHETTALYRKILPILLHRNIMMFHGCVVAVDDKAYMFIAKSGTGKTTHSALWLKNIPGSYILNGDKPLLLFKDSKIYACGTPWQGKENFGTNKIVPLDAICILERNENNHIEKITFKEAFSDLLVQSYRPTGNDNIILGMQLTQNLSKINLFRLGCNMENEAAFVSYNAMKEGKK